jgi:hypothetical protein
VDAYGNETPLGINGFKAFRSYWRDHPDRDDDWAAQMREQLGDERFRREMDCISGESTVTIKWPDGKIENISIDILRNYLSS